MEKTKVRKPVNGGYPISIAHAARLKRTSRVTIYANIKKFDTSPDGRIVPNSKFSEWKPVMIGGRITKMRAAQ